MKKILLLITLIISLFSISPFLYADNISKPNYFHSEYIFDSLTLKGINRVVHRIQLNLTLSKSMDSGEGTILFDPNGCMINQFGDPLSCTKMVGKSKAFKITRIQDTDPKKLGRTIYELTILGISESDRLYLVISRDYATGARIIINDRDVPKRSIYLKAGHPLFM